MRYLIRGGKDYFFVTGTLTLILYFLIAEYLNIGGTIYFLHLLFFLLILVKCRSKFNPIGNLSG